MNPDQPTQVNNTKHKRKRHRKILWELDRRQNLRYPLLITEAVKPAI